MGFMLSSKGIPHGKVARCGHRKGTPTWAAGAGVPCGLKGDTAMAVVQRPVSASGPAKILHGGFGAVRASDDLCVARL